ncbi:MAG: alpha/beta hydrolase [Rhodobacteraceae bacterium]|nr:alpha/beta hydrolase [Paracoccaceae bacterium]
MTTFVLIHGAFQGGWIWKLVANRLRNAGHMVYTPTLDGCGERAFQLRLGITTESQAEEIARFLWSEDLRDVVLVGASAGGMVMAKTAELARDRIERLVFSDALALMHGECIRDITGSQMSVVSDLAIGPTRDDRFKRFSAELDLDLANWAADRSTVHPIGCFMSPVTLENFWGQIWDASVIWCKQAGKPGESHQRRCAEKLGAKWVELDTGHFPMLTMPDEITKIILDG